MPLPNKGRRIISDSIKLKDDAIDAMTEGIDAIEGQIFRLIMSRINEMSSSADGLRITGANAKKLNKLRGEIEDIIKRPKYIKKAGDYLRSFSQIEQLTRDKHGIINGLRIPDDFWQDIRQWSIEYAEQKLLGSGLTAEFTEPLMNEIGQMVLSGANAPDIAEALEARLITDGRGSSLTRYVDQIATDTVNQYQGAIDEKVGREFGLEWIVYIGSIIKTSRAQCRKWVGMEYLHRSELPAEIAWAEGSGSGMIPGTNTGNFTSNRGGYRCRHDATYIDSELVPEDIRERIA